MTKLYGKGTITEIVKGKKYRIALSAGKDPLSGRVYKSGDSIPDSAFAIDRNGKQVKPKIVYGKATDEQKAEHERWKTPVEYLRHQETFLGTKRQAGLRVEEIRRELESGKRFDADKISFSEWCEKYLTMREESGKYRTKTLRQDRSNSKHLLRGLGSVMVVDITPAMVDSLYSSMRKAGVGDTTVKQTHKLLKRVLNYAVRNDIIIRNPVERADAPKKPKPKRRSLSVEDANRLSNICTSGTATANKTAVYLGLALGVRLGEVLGLEWGHVSLDTARPYVHIVQQFTDGGRTAPLKTDEDGAPDPGRIVPIDDSTVAALKAWKSVQRGQLNVLGIEQGNNTPVITNKIGTYTNHSRFQRWWRSFCVENDYGKLVTDDGRQVIELTIGDDSALYPESEYLIEWRDSDGWPCDVNGKRYSRSYKRPIINRHYVGFHYHELRHTHFTMRLASGMDIPTAQALGGWSTPDVLLTTYAHPVAQNIWASAGFMDKLKAKQTA